MIRITDKSQCCGCTACMNVCPHGAISMKTDVLGFPYPVADSDICTDCGLCDKVCDFTTPRRPAPYDDAPVEVFAARNTDASVLMASQSGGAFTALSDSVLAQGGVVYGAVMNEDFSVSHIRAQTAEERNRMRGSKYVQSDMSDVFRLVRKDLTDGRKVLFTGTPCTVAGLASYIPSGLQKGLFLLDFVCHGVPSPFIWRDYVAWMGRRGTIVQACFRDKRRSGWKIHKESFVYSDGRTVERETFRVLFYKNIMLRHSCAVCPYGLGTRRADITIGDFWGIGEYLPELDTQEGTSMIICHSRKGEELMEASIPMMDVRKVVVGKDFLSSRNPNLLRPSDIYKDRQIFEEAYSRKGFRYVAARWGDCGWRYKAWQLKMFFRKMTGKI